MLLIKTEDQIIIIKIKGDQMEIIERSANNDFDAYRVAQGMENAGAQVFSISHNGMHQPFGALSPSSKFIVWAKFLPPVTCDSIDDEIARQFGGEAEDEGVL